ncbi:MAG: signal peptidase I [Eubacteriales bacterium]|nr:signal peptidase I [Eubacteriales bacterium]MDD4323255.1 signal peptidase I [Eubacteriales bacterium]MDD4541261.1 signal peptidase I [Eubacteriales bacterium]
MNSKTLAEIIDKRRKRVLLRKDFISLAVRVLMILLVGWLLLSQVFMITQAQGSAMFPSLKDGDLILAFRLQDKYEQDDIVIYRRDGRQYIGRIAARGADIVSLDDSGSLIVNGTVQSGEIIFPTYAGEALEYPYRVPEDCIFVLGDYRTQSEDSRNFGGIPMEEVEGKVITYLRRRGL